MSHNDREQVYVGVWAERELRDQLAQLARASERSLSSELRVAMREHVHAARLRQEIEELTRP
jgi:hypothetical protein